MSEVISSHIYREGNVCVDKLANMGHAVHGAVWLSALPSELGSDFFRDICGLPIHRFPKYVVAFILFCWICFRGFWPSPLFVYIFPPIFLIKFEIGGIGWRMEVPRGANIVGMSVFPLNVCPLSRLIQKTRPANLFLHVFGWE